MPALHRAVPLAQVDHVPVRVGEHLHLDVPGILEVPLDVDGGVAEVRLTLAPCPRECGLDLARLAHDLHAASPAASGRFDQQRVADLLAEGDTPEPQVRVIGEEQVVAAADMLIANTVDEAKDLINSYDADPARVHAIVKAAFAQRRKTLANGLKQLMGADAIRRAGVDPGARAETLAPLDFVRLAKLADDEQAAS